jgi:hypothetical protein
MPFSTRASTALKRAEGNGAPGSISPATQSSSVVTVKETIEGTLLKRSTSLTTNGDFVTI